MVTNSDLSTAHMQNGVNADVIAVEQSGAASALKIAARVCLAVVTLVLYPATSYAQSCAPTEIPPMFRQAAATDPSHADGDFVPDGEVWLIRAAGIGTYQYVGPGLEYKLQIERAIYWPSGEYAGTWLIPLHVNQALVQGTPMLALERQVILMPKERLVARVTSPPSGLLINLFYLGFKFPLSCLERLVVPSSVVQGEQSVAVSPDFSALIAAAQEAAAKLTTLAASVPPQD